MKKETKASATRARRVTREQQEAQADFPLPPPIELAKLAAILGPNLSPLAALKRAMEFYVAAVSVSGEWPSNLEDAQAHFGTDEQRRLGTGVRRIVEKEAEDTLDLESALSFLAERGLVLKELRSVFDNIERYFQDLQSGEPKPMKADILLEKYKREKAVPKTILQALVEHAKRRRSESKRRAWKTRKGKSPV